MSDFGQSGWERLAKDESEMGVTGEEAGEREPSEGVVEGGEGVALSGISMKASDGKDPERRRVRDGDAFGGEEAMVYCILLKMGTF